MRHLLALFLFTGSVLQSPVTIQVQPGQTPASSIDFTPGACPTVVAVPPVPPTTARLCFSGGQLSVDSGAGYVPVKGSGVTLPMSVTLTCVGEARHSIPSGFSTKCTITQ